MIKKYKEPIELYTTVTDTTEELVKNIKCEILLPQKSIDKINVTLYPNEESHYNKILKNTQLAILGERKNLDGVITQKILINNAIVIGANKTSEGLGLEKFSINLHIRDLLITDILFNREKSPMLHGRVWLSPSKLLNPYQSKELSFTGKVKIKEYSHTDITITTGISLKFKENYKYYTVNDEQISFSELVASFKNESDSFNIESTIKDIDIVLLMASFAERRKIICVGWDTINSETAKQFYRKNISMDNLEKTIQDEDFLINTFYFRKFLDHAYKKYLTILKTNVEFVKSALQMLLNADERRSIENEFITLFTALESLTAFNYFENYPDKQNILPEKKFKQLITEIKSTIKSSKSIGDIDDPKETRSFIYSKLQELNRVPMSKSIELLCSHYEVVIDDLWPISSTKAQSLLDLRNKLVHGDMVDDKYINAIWCATNHLRWTIERIILAILEWDIEKSLVHPKILSHYYPYSDRGLYQLQLKGWNTKQKQSDNMF